MVAITTDSHPHPVVADAPPARLFDFPSRSSAAAGGHPLAPDVLLRVLGIVAAIALVLAVAVGTAALGRVLDGQRGIPASAPATPAAVAVQS